VRAGQLHPVVRAGAARTRSSGWEAHPRRLPARRPGRGGQAESLEYGSAVLGCGVWLGAPAHQGPEAFATTTALPCQAATPFPLHGIPDVALTARTPELSNRRAGRTYRPQAPAARRLAPATGSAGLRRAPGLSQPGVPRSAGGAGNRPCSVAPRSGGATGPCAVRGLGDSPVTSRPGERDALQGRRTPRGIGCRTPGGQPPDEPPQPHKRRRRSALCRVGDPGDRLAHRPRPVGLSHQVATTVSAAGACPQRPRDGCTVRLLATTAIRQAEQCVYPARRRAE
jgi:hypothetical protein